MPEGDTLARTAAGLRPYLVGREVAAAKARAPGPQVDRLVGSTVTGGRGDGQEPADPVRQRARGPDAPADARLVAPLPAGRGVAPAAGSGACSCWRCRARSPCASTPRWSSCSSSGPRRCIRRSRSSGRTCWTTRSTSTRRSAACAHPERADLTVAEGLLDQRALAGIGNEVKNLVLWEAAPLPVDAAPGRRRRRAARPGRAERRGPPHRRRDGPPAAGRPRPRRAPVPAMRDDRAGEGARARAAAPDLLVPELPAGPEERPMNEAIDVRCEPTGDDWTCFVSVTGGGSTTNHAVTLTVGRPRPLRARRRDARRPRPPLVRVPAGARAEGLDPRPLRPAR